VVILIAQEFKKSEMVVQNWAQKLWISSGRPSNGFLLFLERRLSQCYHLRRPLKPQTSLIPAEMIIVRPMMTGKKYLRSLWGLVAILMFAAIAHAGEPHACRKQC
jgi:hypothetical protein